MVTLRGISTQWSGHIDWLLTRDKDINQFLYFYAGLTSKIAGSIAFITVLLITIRLFRSYLNMLELNHHRITLLKTLRPIALVAPVSMRDAIYVKVIDLIARYDSLDQRETSGDVLEKVANSASLQNILTK